MSKGLEALGKIKQTIALKNDGYINLFETLDFLTIEKELKALEIIKGFRKDEYSKMEIDGNDIIINVYLTLDDEEIDLLKEVLL